MTKHHKYQNSKWSQNPGAGWVQEPCTSLPCPLPPPNPAGKSRQAAGTARHQVPICRCCARPLCLRGLLGGEKNMQRAWERGEGENACSQPLPSNWHFCFLEQLLGARSLARLPAGQGAHASSQPDFVVRGCLAVFCFVLFSGRGFEIQQLSLPCYCSY